MCDGIRRAILIMMLPQGVASGVASAGEMVLFDLAATSQIRRIRMLYIKALLSQDIGWFDQSTAGDLTSRLAE
jgi:ABC-type multidrug transport system fused ATPase/permease subunit